MHGDKYSRQKSRQMLHRQEIKPDAVVVAAGCYVQAQEGKEIDPCIDIVIGRNNHKRSAGIIETI